MKMPDPMIPPITTIVASKGPSARLKDTGGGKTISEGGLSPSQSGIQTLDTPAGGLADVAEAVVQAIGTTVPELDHPRCDQESAPERRTCYHLPLETPLGL